MDGLSITGKAVPAHVAALLNRPMGEFHSGIRLLQGTERDAAVTAFKSTLRGLVDEWIDSGRMNEAVTGDAPLERSITWRSPAYPKTLFEILVKFWKAHPALVTVELDGSPVLHVGPSQPAGAEDSLRKAREYAIFEFARLLASPSPQRLSRCDGCKRYFVRERAPAKVIKHGTFCPKAKCRNQGSAKRVNDGRKNLAQDKIRWAADALEQWKPGRRFGERADWVVKQVNAKLPGGERIKVNWFTWHKQEIEKEVERRSRHAKG